MRYVFGGHFFSFFARLFLALGIAGALSSCALKLNRPQGLLSGGSQSINTPKVSAPGTLYVSNSGSLSLHLNGSSPSLLATASDGSSVTIYGVTQGGLGTTAVSGSTITYTPNSGANGKDSITVTVADALSNTTTVAIKINVMTPFTWTGAVSANWDATTQNWCGSVKADFSGCNGGPPPGASDTAVFDGTCATRCDVMISAPVAITAIQLNSGFTGILRQGVGNSITLGDQTAWAGSFTQTSGRFIGSASADSITIYGNSPFTLSGGTFTASSGTLTLRTDYPSSTVVSVTGSAVFNQSVGTLLIGHPVGPCSSYTYTLNFPDGQSLANLSFGDSSGGCGSPKHVDLSGHTINVQSKLTFLDGDGLVDNGNIDLWGSGIVLEQNILNPRGGTAFIRFRGANNQQYLMTQSQGGSPLPGWVINKTGGGTVTPAGTGMLSMHSLQIAAGSFTAPSTTLEFYGDTRTGNVLSLAASGAAFNANGGATSFSKPANITGCTGTFNIDAPGGIVVHDLSFTMGTAGCGNSTPYSITSGQTLTASGAITLGSGAALSGGTLEAQGNLAIDQNFAASTVALLFSGAANQTYSNPLAGPVPNGGIAFAKTGGALTLNDNLSVTTGVSGLTMSGSSTILMSGHNLTVSGTITMAAPATITKGGGVLTLGGSIIGTGTGNMFGTGTVN